MDITFHKSSQGSETVELKESLFEWLAKSDFSRIGESKPVSVHVDGEAEEIPAVVLEGTNRRKLSDFLRDEIVLESEKMLKQLGDSPSKEEYQSATYRLGKLQELRQYVENEHYKYMERTT